MSRRDYSMINKEEPDYTCPDIDQTLDLVEKICSANDALRAWGRKGWNRADELETQVNDLEIELQQARDDS